MSAALKFFNLAGQAVGQVSLPEISGERGQDGASAYDLAVEGGFSGTLEDWLTSLTGRDGERGERGEKGDPGERGERGADGLPGPQAGEVYGWLRVGDWLEVRGEFIVQRAAHFGGVVNMHNNLNLSAGELSVRGTTFTELKTAIQDLTQRLEALEATRSQ